MWQDPSQNKGRRTNSIIKLMLIVNSVSSKCRTSALPKAISVETAIS